jgi:hypothetical protein
VSYDLHVYTPDVGHDVDLAALVAAAGLAREGDGETVVRGRKRRYCFTLARPLAVEPEDVPEEVTAVLVDARLLWELHVEGSTVPEVPHAVGFARRLATAGGGVVLDLQTGQTWHRGVLRAPPPVSRGLIDIVDLRWYVAASSQPAASRGWNWRVATCRRRCLGGSGPTSRCRAGSTEMGPWHSSGLTRAGTRRTSMPPRRV